MKITDVEGKVTFEIGTGEDDITSKKKELKEAFQTALKEYNALDPEAKKTAQKPVKPSVKKIKAISDLADAAKMAMDLQKEYDEKAKKEAGEDTKETKDTKKE